MSGDHGDPLLVLDRVGKGRVAQLLSDQMWFWARGFEGGGPQAELLRRLAYWLMKEPDLEENDLRAIVEGDRLVVTRQSLEPDDRPVTVTVPDGSTRSLTLVARRRRSQHRQSGDQRDGLYRVTDGNRTALAAAGPLNPIEFADVRTTPDKLAPVGRRDRRRYLLGGLRDDAGNPPGFARPSSGREELDGLSRQRRLHRNRVQRSAAAPGHRGPAADRRRIARGVAPRR